MTEREDEQNNKYTTALDFVEKALLVLSGPSGSVFLCSFTAVIGTPVAIVSVLLVYCFLLVMKSLKYF